VTAEVSDTYGIEDIITELSALIRTTLEDGQRKRAPDYWKQDPDHAEAMHRHLIRYDMGELVDEDSGAHPLSHVGVRALMQAYQEGERCRQDIEDICGRWDPGVDIDVEEILRGI